MGRPDYEQREAIETLATLKSFVAGGFNVSISRHRILGEGKWNVIIDKESDGVTFKVSIDHHQLPAAVKIVNDRLNRIVTATTGETS